MKLNKALILAGTAMAGLGLAGHALAQSTASQDIEVVVTGKVKSTAGLGQQVKTAKDQSVVNSEYIKHSVGSANFAQLINLVPGISYSTEDPTGVLSSDLRIHGFDGAHVSIAIDGTPVNDTGNYAVYPGEYAVAESTDKIIVNLGQTEVDSPTASAIGGTVNIVSKVPSKTFGVDASVSAGSYNYKRGYIGLNTGSLGPTGVRIYLSANVTDAEKYKGEGDIKRQGFDGRIYQPLKEPGDFLSLSGTWASNRPIFYYSGGASDLAKWGRDYDYNTVWAPETVTPGVADKVPYTNQVAGVPDFQAGADTNYWALHPNPVDFGDLRGQSRFTLTDKLIFTFDPYFFYTKANGGGGTSVYENDARLIGNSTAAGVDLNGDGDVLDQVVLYSPSNTRTNRVGVNTSLLYDFNDHNRLQFAYNLDYGRHRQTGEYTYVDPETGQPENVFGAITGDGTAIYTADGLKFQKRNRYSIAKLNQFSLNYIGRFMDDKLHVNIGVRNPHFERDLNEFCYVYNGTTEYCDSKNPAGVTAAIAANDAGAVKSILGITPSLNPDGTLNIRAPFKQSYKYTKTLPNAGASYDFDNHNAVYVTYAQGFSAPKTDDLYVSSPEILVQPETTDQYGAGYRFRSSQLDVSANLWAATWHNHIVQSYDPTDPTLSIDRNVGEVKLSGLDLEAGWHPLEALSIYGSAAFNSTELQDNYVVVVSGKTTELPVKGKKLVMTPDQTYSLRAQYKVGDFTIGAETKYTGKRFTSDMNDAWIKSNIVTNLDLTYALKGVGKDTELQLNVSNLFDAKYFPRVSTVNAALPVTTPVGTYNPGTVYYYVNAPQTIYLTLKTKF